jgi:tRNA 2-thiouridine synthesizing protein E
MDSWTTAGRRYHLDAQGFLADPAEWSAVFVESMAARLGMAHLTLQQWRVVLFVRKHYERTGEVARLYITCRRCGLSLKGVRHLFPPGYQRGACRLAGLPYDIIASSHPALTYETASPPKLVYPVTPAGFITDASLWDADFARMHVEGSGAGELGPSHWEVLQFLRDQVASRGRLPCLVRACRRLGLGLEDWDRLFPEGYRRGPWRLAGIPAWVT